jgi:hypothetical protein
MHPIFPSNTSDQSYRIAPIRRHQCDKSNLSTDVAEAEDHSHVDGLTAEKPWSILWLIGVSFVVLCGLREVLALISLMRTRI